MKKKTIIIGGILLVTALAVGSFYTPSAPKKYNFSREIHYYHNPEASKRYKVVRGLRELPACLTTATVRVEIGGEQFAFPRKMIRRMEGKDIVNIRGVNNSSVSGLRACQYSDEPVWSINSLNFHLLPDSCEKKNKCNGDVIYVHIRATDAKEFPKNRKVFPETKQELLEKCKAPLKAVSAYHAKVWNACDFNFYIKKLKIWIIFHGGIYPPEEIEATKQYVLDAIYKHAITSDNNQHNNKDN